MACWLEHIMRWVLMTPLGSPVEPEVNRILATVSGPTRANASPTSSVTSVETSESNRGGRKTIVRIGTDDQFHAV